MSHIITLSPRMHRNAFTLLELAIVIVIIGLLVGGIAAFGSYTKNARINTMMNESKILISAFNQFQTRYGTPPGDYCSFPPLPALQACGTEAVPSTSGTWPGARNGDANGIIRAGSTAFPLELYYAFQHLALAGFIQGTYTGAANSFGGATAGVNVAGSALEKSGFIFDHPDAADGLVSGDALYFDGFYGNILRIAGLSDKSAALPALGILTPKDALTLDLKFDDGQPGLGNIKTPKSTALADCASSAATSATYLTTGNRKSCYLFLGMQ